MSDDPTREGGSSASRRRLASETGFWRNLTERGGLGEEMVERLRNDLGRLDARIETLRQGETAVQDERHRELWDRLASLEKDYGTQFLVVQTLIEILVEKGVMTEDEFVDTLDDIDARDGVMDGQIHPGPDGKESKKEPSP